MLKWGFTFYKLFTQQQTTLQSALSLFSNGFTETYSPTCLWTISVSSSGVHTLLPYPFFTVSGALMNRLFRNEGDILEAQSPFILIHATGGFPSIKRTLSPTNCRR